MVRFSVEQDAERFLKQAAERASMSGRAIMRTLGIARTIADMAESTQVGTAHIAEALALRLREGGK